ncbi:right-handed parallel beta-helix repeat-containing protein [Micromonospora sp. WMMC250]|uniref:right-handed parallel beta-helix repeat-containing protein n=1 Tax=Micromonospora sp. WMMC250 TaxID=3014781 RepID=UPI0022B73C8E|nr:right-handed parallel beta-helix repeat-containing protein [Micromonospora sp. WMMC250]MCZ7377089.1 right-handed parallel beta-helix repeat-containing protein [Micromonospora sp. WMMC250]
MEMVSRRSALRAGLVSTVAVGGLAASEVAAQAAPVGATADTGVGWISVLDHGAVGDGTTDDTAAIQATLNAAATSRQSVYFPAGRVFRVRDQLTAQGLTDVVIAGDGATVALTGAAYSVVDAPKAVLQFRDCRRVKLVGLTVRDTDRSQQYNGVRISSSTEMVVDGVRVHSVRVNGIVVFDDPPRTTDNVLITNCTTEDTRFGISSNGKDVRITDNHVAMDWPSTDEARRYGGVHPGYGSDSDYFDGICVWAGADRTVVANNTITECGQSGVYVQAVSNVVVADNTVTGCQLRGIEIDGLGDAGKSVHGRAMGVSITGNVVVNCLGQINLIATTDATVVGNRVANGSATKPSSGIAVNLKCSKVVVSSNHVRQANPAMPALFVKDNDDKDSTLISTDVTLAWNTVEAAIPYAAPAETVVMHRSGPAMITAQGSLKTSGKVIAGGGLGVGNTVTATSVGSIVRKMEVFSSTGQSLGWVAIHNS